MVCGELKQFINHAHLKQHGLTIQQYKERFKEARIYSDEFLLKRIWEHQCRKCGAAFTTKSPHVVYCPPCQFVISLEKRRRKNRRNWARWRMRHGEGSRQVGTFRENGKYLKVVDGRIFGTILLEKNVGLNDLHKLGSLNRYLPPRSDLECNGCGSDFFIIIEEGKAYCSECGSRIMLARENEHYSLPIEPCCEKCGLVYQIPFFSVRGENLSQL